MELDPIAFIQKTFTCQEGSYFSLIEANSSSIKMPIVSGLVEELVASQGLCSLAFNMPSF